MTDKTKYADALAALAQIKFLSVAISADEFATRNDINMWCEDIWECVETIKKALEG